MPDDPVTDFEAWNPKTLAQFAAEALNNLKQQQEEIERLTEERQIAIRAYRELIMRTPHA